MGKNTRQPGKNNIKPTQNTTTWEHSGEPSSTMPGTCRKNASRKLLQPWSKFNISFLSAPLAKHPPPDPQFQCWGCARADLLKQTSWEPKPSPTLKLGTTGGNETKLKFAWGHIGLLQEVLSISRMHLIEGDIPYAGSSMGQCLINLQS